MRDGIVALLDAGGFDVVGTALYLASAASRFTTGATLAVDDGSR